MGIHISDRKGLINITGSTCRNSIFSVPYILAYFVSPLLFVDFVDSYIYDQGNFS